MAKDRGSLRQSAIKEAAKALNEASHDLTRALGQELGEAGEQMASSLAASLQKAAASLESAAGQVRTSAKAERTKQALLDAAAKVIAAKGYEGASVGDIAEEAGFTKGAIYAHFGSKEELFLELARAQGLLACALAEQVETGEATLVDWFTERVALTLEADAAEGDDNEQQVLLGTELSAFALRHPEHREELAGYEDAVAKEFARKVYRDRTGRELGDGEDIAAQDLATVHAMMGLGNSLLLQRRAGVTGITGDMVRDLFARIARP